MRLFEMRATFASLERRQAFLAEEHPIQITKEEKGKGWSRVEGEFTSPLFAYHPDLFEPPSVARARFEMILPSDWRHQAPRKPLAIHMAGTGDHHFWRRRFLMCKPLASEYGSVRSIFPT